MKVLLDTHALIWSAVDPSRLSARAAEVIVDQDNYVYVGAVSVWEISVERAKRLLRFPEADHRMLSAMRFTELSVSIRHASAVGHPLAHHRDPFESDAHRASDLRWADHRDPRPDGLPL